MNLTCDELRELLYDHHEGELVVEKHDYFQAHLVTCAHCVHYVESYTHTVRVVRKLPRCGLPNDVEARLRAALKDCLGEK